MSRSPESQSPFACLTARQREVLELVAKGHTNTEIAEHLGISLDGAKWHVSELLTRLTVDTREDLAQLWHDEHRIGRRAGRWFAGLAALPSLKTAVVSIAGVGIVAGSGVAALFVAGQFAGNDGWSTSESPRAADTQTTPTGPEVRVAWLDGVTRTDDAWLGYYPTADGYCVVYHPGETLSCSTVAPARAPQATVEVSGSVQGRPAAPKRSTLTVIAPPDARWLDVSQGGQLQMYRFEPTDPTIGRTFGYVTIDDPLADTTVIAYSEDGVELGRYVMPPGWATGGIAPAESPTPAAATATTYGPDALDYAAHFGVSPGEAQRRLDVMQAMSDFVPRFREAAPDRFTVMSVEHTPALRWIAWYTGEDDDGLAAAHALADSAPGEVEIRTGAPASEAHRLEIAEQLRDVAQQLGLLHERDMLSLGAGNGAGTVELWVTQRPIAEADAVAAALTDYFDAPIVVTVTDVPPWGSRPEQANAADPIARLLPANMSLTAAIGGVLMQDGACLYLITGAGPVLAAFPYAATWENGAVVVGTVRLTPGDTVSAGGHTAEPGTDVSAYTWGTRPDPSCDTSNGVAFMGSI